MKKSYLSMVAAFAVALACGAAIAKAETSTIRVNVDESQILQLPSAPGAIVIGNPAIADVSIQGQQLFIHGRSYGQTNLTILDLEGKQLANFKLVGTLVQDDLVTLFRQTNRYTLSCADNCSPNIQVGDEPITFEDYAKETGRKFNLALGNPTAEAKAPEAPQ
jgi:Pilus formation protein N terminal region